MIRILNKVSFQKDNYEIEICDGQKTLKCVKKVDDEITCICGSKELIGELVDTIIILGISFKKTLLNKDVFEEFEKEIVYKISGDFKILNSDDNGVLVEYFKGNISTVTLAGGCFWCMAKPYYEYEGILKVYSGYSGGVEIMPSYEEVKSQMTTHKECVKLIYDSSVITLKEILDIYFDTIDPFDEEGQFIDRGQSYSTAIFYKNEVEKEFVINYINTRQKEYDRSIVVKIEEECIFYMAEEYHQDYAIKNPDEMEKELIESGRKKVA